MAPGQILSFFNKNFKIILRKFNNCRLSYECIDFRSRTLYIVTTYIVAWNEKLLSRFLNNPGSLRFNQIENLLLQIGFQKISVKGSHRKYRHPLLKNGLIVPVHNNDCKKFYKIYIAKLIKQGWQI